MEELIINSIDLWTEQYKNHYECFNGVFVDGFENNKKPFDEYKIVKNCNCIITQGGRLVHMSERINDCINDCNNFGIWYNKYKGVYYDE